VLLAGTDDRVAGLVCIAAPDETETSQGQQDKFPVTDVFSHIEIADGRAWMLPSGAACFAGDLPEEEQKVVWATHFAPAFDLFLRSAPGVAWRSKPSWYIVAANDHTVHPELERAAAKRMGATTYELDSSHVPISQPDIGLLFSKLAASTSYEQFSVLVRQSQGSAGLMRFLLLDLDSVLTLDPRAPGWTGRRLVRLIAGNPVTAGEMTRHLPDAGTYAPVTILISSGNVVKLTGV